MENHPIPQDVTGFQFKLIGDMTVKQFAYLAAGVISGWAFWSVFPLIAILKFPIALLMAGLGAGMAFLPLAGRPMDVMILNYIRALFAPNQYIYRKRGGQLAYAHFQGHVASGQATTSLPKQSKEALTRYLRQLSQARQTPLDEKESAFISSLAGLFSNAPAKPQGVTSTPAQTTSIPIASGSTPLPMHAAPKILSMDEEKSEESRNTTDEEANEKSKEDAAPVNQPAQPQQQSEEQTPQVALPQEPESPQEEPQQNQRELEKELSQTKTEKQELEEQLVKMQSTLETQGKQVFTPTEAKAPIETKRVRSIPKTMGTKTGVPIMPQAPNLIAGVVKDSRDNVLPNILVEVKDSEGNPVRAFKTNGLGQFASATPLPIGTFTLNFEDPKGVHKFDTIELVTNGEILMPLEVISIDAREELRRTLFS